MSDDWKPGDLALCIKAGRLSRVGHIYEVAVALPKGERCGCGQRLLLKGVCLLFVGRTAADDRGCQPWASSTRFRKVTPREADEFDRETIRLLTGQPAKEDA